MIPLSPLGPKKLYRLATRAVHNTRLTPEDQPGHPTQDQAEDERELEPRRGRKFYVAMACYAGIALLAGLTLDGNFRLVVWVFLGYLAFRTYLHTLRKP